MRYITLKTEVNSDGTITISGAHKVTQKASSSPLIEWIDVKNAVTNTINPENCDFVSFDSREGATDFLSDTGMDSDNITVIGVEVD